MAIALVAHTSGGSMNGGSMTTPPMDSTGANFLALVWVEAESLPTSTLSDSLGNTWLLLPSQQVSGASRSRLAYVARPTVGAGHTVTVTVPGGLAMPSLCVSAFSGVTILPPLDGQTGAVAANATTLSPGSVTPLDDGALIVTGLGSNLAGVVSITAGWTITDSTAFRAGQHYGARFAYLVQPTVAAVAPTWTTANSVPLTAVIAAFADASLIQPELYGPRGSRYRNGGRVRHQNPGFDQAEVRAARRVATQTTVTMKESDA